MDGKGGLGKTERRGVEGCEEWVGVPGSPLGWVSGISNLAMSWGWEKAEEGVGRVVKSGWVCRGILPPGFRG